MNYVFLIGNLADHPEVKTTQGGISVTTFRIGVNRRVNRDITDFFTVVTWRGLADNCGKYLVKGQKVAVIGELQTRSYDDKNGVKRYITEISADAVEFLSKPSNTLDDNLSTDTEKTAHTGAQSATEGFEDIPVLLEDEDLPF